MNTLEITIQRKIEDYWPVVVEFVQSGQLPLRREGQLQLGDDQQRQLLVHAVSPREYGSVLGRALFADALRDTFVQARISSQESLRVLLVIEAEDLKSLHWERLCAPIRATGSWDFLTLDQRTPFSLYLPSSTDRRYPAIGRRDLNALVLVADPPGDNPYGLDEFDAEETVGSLRDSLGDIPHTVLSNVVGASGPPTLDSLLRQITTAQYTLLHVVAHGSVRSRDQETVLYLLGDDGTVRPVTGTEFLDRLDRTQGVRGLPHFTFLATCESANPKAEEALGGLAQRMVRELGMPAVLAMTERVSIETAGALAQRFYRRLRIHGQPDQALVEASIDLAERGYLTVPALFGRLGGRPLFSDTLERDLNSAEMRDGLELLLASLPERAPVLQERLVQLSAPVRRTLDVDPLSLADVALRERDQALGEINHICEEVLDLNFRALALGQEPPPYDGRQPFRGLYPFLEVDREFFFGREQLVATLQRRMGEYNFLAVVGPSGSGKSSLAMAGLVPAMRRNHPDLGVAYVTPGDDPLARLAVATNDKTDVVVVDQFEELFTLTGTESVRADFVREILDLAERKQVVLTMRADFLGECAVYPKLRAYLQSHQELIGPMDSGELRSAMEQQARAVGLRFEADLSNTILDAVQDEPGAMPLLQHALLELWRRRHGRWLLAAEYRALGGVQRAIAETAEEIYLGMGNAERDQMRNVFLRLTRPGGGRSVGERHRDVRQRATLHELVSAGAPDGRVGLLIQQLATARLVVISQNPANNEDEVEVAHEALIQHWPRLAEWIDEDRELLGLLTTIRDASIAWSDAPEQDRDSFLVHRGSRLEEIEQLVDAGRLQLSAEEEAYVHACIQLRDDAIRREKKQQERELMQARRLVVALAALLGGAILAGIVIYILFDQARLAESDALQARNEAVLARNEAEDALVSAEQARLEEAKANAEMRFQLGNLLAQRAGNIYDTTPQEAALLSLEALRLQEGARSFHTGQVETSLRTALANLGGSPIVGEDYGPSPPVFSPDGRTLALLTGDGGVRLLDLTKPNMEHEQPGGEGGSIRSLAWDPNMRWLAGAGNDGIVRLWDAENLDGEPVLLNAGSSALQAVATTLIFDSDGRRLASGADDGSVFVWDLNDIEAEPAQLTAGDEALTTLTFGLDGRRLAAGDVTGMAYAWDLDEFDPITHPIDARGGSVQWLAFGTDADWLAIADLDGSVRTWRWSASEGTSLLPGHPANARALLTADGEPLRTIDGDGIVRTYDPGDRFQPGPEAATGVGQTDAAAVGGDGRWLAAVGSGNSVRVVSLEDLQTQASLPSGYDGAVQSVAISYDGSWTAAIGKDNSVRLTNVRRPTVEPVPLHMDTHGVASAVFAPGGEQLAIAGGDGSLWLWKTNSLDPPKEVLTSPSGMPIAPTVATGEGWMVVGSADADVHFWNLAQPDPVLRSVPGDVGQVSAYSSSGDSKTLAAMDRLGRVWVWDLGRSLSGPQQLGAEDLRAQAMAIDPGGNRLATGHLDGSVQVWDIERPDEPNKILRFGGSRISTVAFGRDGRWLYAGKSQGDARLWDAGNLDAWPIDVGGHTTAIQVGTFSTDGEWLVTADASGAALLWDLSQIRQLEQPLKLLGHEKSMKFAVFSPDGKWLATADVGGTVRVWDMRRAQDRQELTYGDAVELRGHEGAVTALSFSPDSQRLATGDTNGTIRLWRTSIDDVVSVACAVVGRNLSWPAWDLNLSSEEYRLSCSEWPAHTSYVAHLIEEALLLEQNEQEGALDYYDLAVEMAPDSGDALVYRGEYFRRVDEPERALSDFQRAVELEPENGIYNGYVCWAAACLGQAEEALDACNVAVYESTGEAAGRAHNFRALALAMTGDYAAAADDLRAYVTWLKEYGLYDSDGHEPETWIERLDQDENPFDADTVERRCKPQALR